MTTNKYVVYGKVTETNLVQRHLEYFGEKINKRKLKRKCNAQKDRILKCVKYQWEKIIHIKIN